MIKLQNISQSNAADSLHDPAPDQMQAVIYCRVSSKGQESTGHGLQSQETRCRHYAAGKGYQVAAVFPDTFTGGGDFMKRPGMVALLSFLDAQPDTAFTVIFDDLKRFARDTKFHFDLREAFRKRGATIECLNFTFDDTPEGEFIKTILAAQGALERKQNGRQVAQKMKARMQNGYWIHNAPVGYRYQTLRGHGKILVPDEPMASVIREAFEGYALERFQTQTEVARFFESQPDFPYLRNGKLRLQRVTDILTQPLYAGYICSETYGINWLKGQHQPLIPLNLFDKAQARRKVAAKLPKRDDIGNDFALRGFVTCAGCGHMMRSGWSKGEYKRYAYYLCQRKGCEAYGKSIPRDRLETDVGDLIKNLQPRPSMVRAVTAMFHAAWEARLVQAKDIAAQAKVKLREADKQIESLLSRIMAATNDRVIATYEAKIADIEADKARWSDRLIEAETAPKPQRREQMLELSLAFLANPWKIWQSGNITLRRIVIKLAFADRLAYDRNEGARTPEFALPFKDLTPDSNGNIFYGAPEWTELERFV